MNNEQTLMDVQKKTGRPIATEQRAEQPGADLGPVDTFVRRHIGPRNHEVAEMLEALGLTSLDQLVDQTVPASIRLKKPLTIGEPRGEFETLAELRTMAQKNKVMRSFIGLGYHDTITPPVIQRNILENPGWYTQYTPYQAEIAQGRLEALLNFQTMVADLTALPLANASLLDEATAAAEAMNMCRSIVTDEKKTTFFVSQDCHPQTIAVVRTRAKSLGIRCIVGDEASLTRHEDFEDEEKIDANEIFGILLQYPTTDGRILDYSGIVDRTHKAGALVVCAADILALTLIKPPGEFGVDIAVGSTQRFGVPMGFGGPHAAYMATKEEYARKMPGRIVGVSRDAQGNPAYRLSLQTREQHIRRERATSNICTAQVLLAVIAGMYAVYHGPKGLRRIAERVHTLTRILGEGLKVLGFDIPGAGQWTSFDAVQVASQEIPAEGILREARRRGLNLREYDLGDVCVGVSLDETATPEDVAALLDVFATAAGKRGQAPSIDELFAALDPKSKIQNRKSDYLTHPVFNTHHSETEMLRYMRKLESRDLSLTHSMIPLGSCTMKLNATAEMFPVTWPEFGRLHPFAPDDQTQGYQQLFADLEKWLAEITGFAAVSLQPNAGSQGEYAGLLAIRGYHESRKQGHRDVCLIPVSAHGTNPSSAIVAGLKVIPVACDDNGNIELSDLRERANQHKDKLAAVMITYPSTHGVFEEDIREICKIVHDAGGQVYMDGANMNAQVGLTSPGEIGADVCHLNLHKTFCIPHGGGGPGMGPIGVAKHLAPFLPARVTIADSGLRIADSKSGSAGEPLIRNPKSEIRNASAVGPVSAAPYGSPSILVIPWVYIRLMGGPGLTRATEVAILSANYMAKRLEAHYPILFKGKNGRVAHEFVMDVRQFEQSAGIKAEDIAKRLMDYGFHAPTMSWPVVGTLMIEPTESEPKAELDRFCDALIRIREEIRAIEQGTLDRTDNPLRNAPHPASTVIAHDWKHKYGREQAAFPAPWLREHKFWPAVARIDNPFGDRNLICTCPPMDSYQT